MDSKEYETRFEKLFREFNEAHLFFFTWRALQKEEYEKHWKQESNFWNAVNSSLNKSWMLALAKIYEESSFSKKDEIISLFSLVNHQIDSGRQKQIKDFLNMNKNLFKNIKIIRDNILAHINAEYKMSREDLFKKFPIKYGEIEKLFEATEELFHLLHPQSNHSLSMEGFNQGCETDVKKIMEKIAFFTNEQRKHFERIENGVPYSEFPPKSVKN